MEGPLATSHYASHLLNYTWSCPNLNRRSRFVANRFGPTKKQIHRELSCLDLENGEEKPKCDALFVSQRSAKGKSDARSHVNAQHTWKIEGVISLLGNESEVTAGRKSVARLVKDPKCGDQSMRERMGTIVGYKRTVKLGKLGGLYCGYVEIRSSCGSNKEQAFHRKKISILE
jgi:hypothetical protein